MLPIDLLTLGAALLAGLLGNAHCTAMCGGIAAGLSRSVPRVRAASHALQLNGGRVFGYGVAGALGGGLGASVLTVAETPGLALTLRIGMGLMLLWVALRIAGLAPFPIPAGTSSPASRLLVRLQRCLPPPGHPLRPWMQGALWGWLPCGLSLSMLGAAWLEASALHGALLMLAFGLGTLPVMTTLSYSGARVLGRLQQGPWRWGAAGLVAASGLLTIGAPWLAGVPALQGALHALGCRSLSGGTAIPWPPM